MIPKVIHYCWFGRSEMPQSAKDCIASWHELMPDWEYKLWNEENFDVNQNSYTKEAYEAGKFAFVSDYVRLWSLERYGGLYLDTDVKVFKRFDDLMINSAFAGFEGSKHLPMCTCVMASKAHGTWVSEMLRSYDDRHFRKEDGTYDMTTNVQYLTARMQECGFVQDGSEQECMDLHIFPVEYFCPRQTTGEYLCTGNTYCDHIGLGSWSDSSVGWKFKVKRLVGNKMMIHLIKLKRKLLG